MPSATRGFHKPVMSVATVTVVYVSNKFCTPLCAQLNLCFFLSLLASALSYWKTNTFRISFFFDVIEKRIVLFRYFSHSYRIQGWIWNTGFFTSFTNKPVQSNESDTWKVFIIRNFKKINKNQSNWQRKPTKTSLFHVIHLSTKHPPMQGQILKAFKGFWVIFFFFLWN